MKRIILNFLIIVLSVLYGLRTVVNEPFKQLVFDLIYTAIEGPYLNPYEQALLEQKSDEVRHDISFNDHWKYINKFKYATCITTKISSALNKEIHKFIEYTSGDKLYIVYDKSTEVIVVKLDRKQGKTYLTLRQSEWYYDYLTAKPEIKLDGYILRKSGLDDRLVAFYNFSTLYNKDLVDTNTLLKSPQTAFLDKESNIAEGFIDYGVIEKRYIVHSKDHLELIYFGVIETP